jgi:hypothetical protein
MDSLPSLALQHRAAPRIVCIQGALKKIRKRKQGAKNNPGKKPIFLFAGQDLSMRAGCGHATACGHPAS